MEKATNNSKAPKPASTVILIRENIGELQVYLLRRSGRSNFMPGNYVFPGGTLDREDRDPGLWGAHSDKDLKTVSQRLGGEISVEAVLAHAITAIRETFEEAGAYLGHRDGEAREDLEKVCARRMTEGLSQGWFHDLVISGDWTVSFSRLARWAHWITPKLMPKRYDTRFFLGFMPKDQQCAPDAKETTHGTWISPEKALAGNFKEEIPLSPPTLVTLHELLEYSSIEDLKRITEKRPWGEPRTPHLIQMPGEALILLPWDPMYNQDVEVNARDLAKRLLAPGKPFSRLWHHEGIWRPVSD